MDIKNNFYIDIGKVSIAHEFVINRHNKCDYSQGRRIYGFSFAVSGEAEYRFASGKRYYVKAGEMIYLSSDSAYTLTASGEYRHYTVNFDISEKSRKAVETLGQISVLRCDNPGHVKNIFRELTMIWKSKKIGYEMNATAYVYQLFSEFISELCVGGLKSKGYNKVIKAKEYIEQNCCRAVSISHLAQLCSMSETNFRRVFVFVVGETPLQYRERLLTALAKEYLLSGFYTAAEVSELCGFDDPSYFGRFFKKHTGLTPGEFKIAK